MILSEKQLHSRILEPIIGKPLELDFKKLKPIGSTRFYLQSIDKKNEAIDALRINSKCSFQIYERGFLVKAYSSTRVNALPIKYSDIIELKLIRGKEQIHPVFPSKMWILLKLGVSILKARYFKSELSEYTIEDMVLELITSEYTLYMTGNGHDYENQEVVFKRTPVNLQCIIK